MQTTLAQPAILDKPNLASKLASKFYKSKEDLNARDLSWQIRNLTERLEYLEFTMREAINIIEELQGNKQDQTNE